MKTNKELGAVYLEVKGLDKERFKELTKGMNFSKININYNLNHGLIENFIHKNEENSIWLGIRDKSLLEPNSRLITLDELEELLHGTKPKPTHFAISPEDYEEYQELKKLKEQLKKFL